MDETTTVASQKPRSFLPFLTIWFGQTISMLGSGLTGFALGVWLFQQTGNATPMAITALSQWLPRILLAPIAGIVADRFSRKVVMIVADSAAALATGVGALLVITGSLEVWHIYLIAAWIGAAESFQAPAFTASITLLVEKKQYTRAAAMRQISQAIETIASPIIAGALVGIIGLSGIIIIDLITFSAALVTMLIVAIPRPAHAGLSTGDRKSDGFRAALYGLRYIGERHGLLAMLVYFALVNFVLNFAVVLITPMILSFTDAQGLGIVQTTAGVGMLIGSVLVSVFGTPKNKMRTIYLSIFVTGLGLAFAGVRESLPIIAGGFFAMMLANPFGNGPSMAIWQSKVEPAVQGRVFAATGMVSTAMMPVAYALAGPLADHVFQPFMNEAPPRILSALVGTGAARGYAVMIFAAGIATCIATGLFAAYRPLRRVDEELPDYDAASAASGTAASEAAAPGAATQDATTT